MLLPVFKSSLQKLIIINVHIYFSLCYRTACPLSRCLQLYFHFWICLLNMLYFILIFSANEIHSRGLFITICFKYGWHYTWKAFLCWNPQWCTHTENLVDLAERVSFCNLILQTFSFNYLNDSLFICFLRSAYLTITESLETNSKTWNCFSIFKNSATSNSFVL